MKKTGLILGAIALAGVGAYLATSKVNAYRGDPNVKGPNYTEERHQEMTQAFEKNDYQAWKKLMAGRGRASEVVTEENFAQFAKAHQLMLEGKIDEARQIRAELGLGRGKGNGQGQEGKPRGGYGMRLHQDQS